MKRFILTGGSDGLGKEFAKLCIAKNIEIVCLSRSKPDYMCAHVETDLADERSIKNAADIIHDRYATFNAVINCAGIMSLEKPNNLTYGQLQNVFAINVLAPVFLTSLLFDIIKKNEADIINVGSTVGTKAYPDQAAYGGSKWALRGISQNLQLEFKNTACRVIQFNPGGFKSRIFEKATGLQPDLKSYMQPADLAAIMLYTLELPKSVEISEILINRK